MRPWPEDVIDQYGGQFPEWLAQIRGIPEERIQYLEKICGCKLPECYRQYLKYFGESDGGIMSKITEVSYCDFETVLDLVVTTVEDFPEDKLEDGWLEVISSLTNFMLNLETCVVHSSECYGDDGLYSDHWKILFEQQAFDYFYTYRQPYILSYMCSKNSSEQLLKKVGRGNAKSIIQVLSKKWGLVDIGLDDSIVTIRVLANEVFLSSSNFEGENPFIISGKDIEKLRLIGDDLASAVGAELV